MLRNRTMPDCPVLPTLVYPKVAAAIDWLCCAFGLQERWRTGGDRAQLAVGGAAIVLTEARTGQGWSSPDDEAVRAPRPSLRERQCSAEDPLGYRWGFPQSVADVRPEDGWNLETGAGVIQASPAGVAGSPERGRRPRPPGQSPPSVPRMVPEWSISRGGFTYRSEPHRRRPFRHHVGMAMLPPELRRVPPVSFVAARDALARRLRQEGDREGAAAVRRLRRPPAALWALNGLAGAAPERVAELVRAGQALRAMTQAALGGRQTGLGRLGGEHGRLVEELTGRAMTELEKHSVPATRETRARVWTLLRVASLDPAAAAALTEGALAEEPVSVGFEGLQPLAVDEPGAEASPPGPDASAERTAAAARRRLDRADQVRAAIAQMEFARVEAEAGRSRLTSARQRVADLRVQLRTAQREEARLQRNLTAAEEAVEAAEQGVERLRGHEA